jgi:hypothetical protein
MRLGSRLEDSKPCELNFKITTLVKFKELYVDGQVV